MEEDKVTITLEMIRVYDYYKGSDDGLGHGPEQHRLLFPNSEFYIIKSMIQDLKFIERRQASVDYSHKAFNRINELCENKAAIDFLNSILPAY